MILNANLPDSKVKAVIMSGQYKYLVDSINDLGGIEAVTTSVCPQLQTPVAYHADMQCLHIGNKLLIARSGSSDQLIKKCRQKNIDAIVTDDMLHPDYPKDTILNCAVLGKYCFCNIKNIDNKAREEFIHEEIQPINIKQGYSKCSVAIVAEKAIITADVAIYSQAKKYGFDALKISVGNIFLPGYDYGFIGGSCGKISNDVMAFCGCVSAHPDYNNIKSFMLNYGVHIEQLSNLPLMDIGGILPIL